MPEIGKNKVPIHYKAKVGNIHNSEFKQGYKKKNRLEIL